MFERFLDKNEPQRLPISGNKYLVTITGIVTEGGFEVKPSKNLLGDLVVQIDWFGGYKEYSVALLVAHTFKPLSVPVKWWNDISVLFADNDKDNIHPSNLVWKFPIGLGSSKHNGFSFIPMFSKYMVNRDGVVFDTRTMKIIGGHFNKGYHSYSLLPDVGPRSSLKRHRAICLAFTNYPSNVDSMYVNHINGIPGDDRIENLEWVTSSENRIHAIENNLTLVNKPVIVRNLLSGEEVEYFSLKTACAELKLDRKKVSANLGQLDGVHLTDEVILEYKNPDHAFIGNANKCAILVRDLKTGIITEYDSIVGCAKSIGKSVHAVASRIEAPTSNLYSDYLQIKRKSDKTQWYDPIDYEQELLETSWAKKILVRNLMTNKTTEFNTQREASKYLGVADSTIVKWLSYSNQPVFKNENDGTYVQVKRKHDLSSWRNVDNPEEEYCQRLSLRPVLVKNVINASVVEYNSAHECAKDLKILPTTLNWRLKSQGQKIYPPGLQFKYKDEELEFAKVNIQVHSIISTAPFD